MRVLIEGAAGQLGCALTKLFATGVSDLGPLPAAYEGVVVDAVDYQELDMTDGAAVRRWFDEHDPYDVVINCAAMTNVDGCDADPAAAFRLNAEGPALLAASAARTGARLIQVSTDYVFPGTDPVPRVESDPVGPLSAYGRTKLAGEWAVRALCPQSHVVRTAWLYGLEGKNFVKTMLALGESHAEVTVVDDQRGNPTYAADLAFELARIALCDDYGVWHCTNNGVCSWAEFAAAIMAEAGLDCTVRPVTSAQWKELHPETASRPAYSSLENAHLASTIGDKMRLWRDALSSFMTSHLRPKTTDT